MKKSNKITLPFYKTLPPDHAQNAYDKGYYIEAIQVLHSWIEVKLQELLLIGRHRNIRHNYSEVWDSVFSIPFLQIAKVLFVIGRFDKTTFHQIKQFNTMRNAIIHRVFNEDYNKGLIRIDMNNYNKSFKFGMKLCKKLEGILAKLATRK